VWGLGLPLGIFAWVGGALFVWNAWRTHEWRAFFLLSWALVYFVLVGAQYTKYLRYLLPLLPILYLMAVQAVLEIKHRFVMVGITAVLMLSLLYALAFDSIYGREHPWLAASSWIYKNIAPGSTLLVEEWDDALPVMIQLNDGEHRATAYHQTLLHIYSADDDAKLNTLATELAHADVVILASQRAYGSIGRLPERYPLTARYYQKLFDGELGFALAATAHNDIALGELTIRDDPRAGLVFDSTVKDAAATWDWGFADESFSVYDHPQPLIFVKRQVMSYSQLYSILQH
jgi:hypothetical protein